MLGIQFLSHTNVDSPFTMLMPSKYDKNSIQLAGKFYLLEESSVHLFFSDGSSFSSFSSPSTPWSSLESVSHLFLWGITWKNEAFQSFVSKNLRSISITWFTVRTCNTSNNMQSLHAWSRDSWIPVYSFVWEINMPQDKKRNIIYPKLMYCIGW